MFMTIEDAQGKYLWFNLMLVTHVTERKLLEVDTLVIHFQGGSCENVAGWTIAKWEAMLNKIQRQASLMLGKGGQA